MRTLLAFFLGLAALLCGTGDAAAAGRAQAKRPPRPQVVVVRAAASCPPSERQYAEAMARHVSRILSENGVSADEADDRSLDSVLWNRRLAILVMMSAPSAAQMEAMARFRRRGGRFVVFSSSSPALADLMGVRLGTYRKVGYGDYGQVVFAGGVAQELPRSFRLPVRGFMSAFPVKGRSRTAATWCGATGRRTADSAVIFSDAGWWVTNVLAMDCDEIAKAKFILAMVGHSAPGAWNAAAWRARQQARRIADWKYGSAQRPRRGEIHAVWDHSGLGLYPGDWRRTMELLSKNGITDLFVNVAGAGFAHCASSVLPGSEMRGVHGDQLAACLSAAQGTGVRVHAWVLCFNGTRASPSRRAELKRRGWLLRSASGGQTDYLDPSRADVREHMQRAIAEIAARYKVHGVHLDFVRWYESAAGRPAAGAARPVTAFVASVRRELRAARPNAWLTAAVLGSYPSCIGSVGQDWGAWLDAGLIDYAVPMNYTGDMERLRTYLSRQCASKARASRIICGIGVTANESRLSPRQVVDQVNLARRHGLAGVALFDLDDALAAHFLPILRLGLFGR